MTQKISLLAVATVFIGLWTVSTVREGEAYLRDSTVIPWF